MRRVLRPRRLVAVVVLVLLGTLAAPSLLRFSWRVRSSNPVRRGLGLATELGCFSCHGPNGSGGPPDPGLTASGVPAWSGGVWMMYVDDAEEIREFIRDGVSERRRQSVSARREREQAAIQMPAYGALVDEDQLDDLTAAFVALSGMARPPNGSAADRGRQLALEWSCFSCHGPEAAGGMPNPGSFTGFVPGWYGPDFEDLVRDREELVEWVRTGSLERLLDHWLAARALDRQRVKMPAYPELTDRELDDLWAFFIWLAAENQSAEAS